MTYSFLSLRHAAIQVWLVAGEHLEDEHAKGIHVGSLGEDKRVDVFGRHPSAFRRPHPQPVRTGL